MKRNLLLVSALLLSLGLSLQAQTLQVTVPQAQVPQAIQYQTIIRDGDGVVVMNQAVGLQLTVRQTTADGTAKYQETHTATTNAFGLVNLQIGMGTPTSGTLEDNVDWSMGPYYLEVGLDLTGGSSYTVMGTTQLLSVPYALYAERANVPGVPGPQGPQGLKGDTGDTGDTGPQGLKGDTGEKGDEGPQGPAGLDGADGNTVLNGTVAPTTEGEDGDFYINTATNEIFGPKAGGTWPTPGTSLVGPAGSSGTHYVGEVFDGGIVFFVDETGEHGLMASLEDLNGGTPVTWSNLTSTLIGASAQSFYDGVSNTAAIIAEAGHTSSAAKLCDDYAGGGKTDWYLPSHQELYLLGNNSVIINKVLANDGDSNTNGLNVNNNFNDSSYWSSTENNSGLAWFLQFRFGSMSFSTKLNPFRVRAVRAF